MKTIKCGLYIRVSTSPGRYHEELFYGAELPWNSPKHTEIPSELTELTQFLQ